MALSESEARALYDSGAPVTHVAKALDMSVDAFRRWRQKQGWPMRSSPIVRKRPAITPAPKVRAARKRKSTKSPRSPTPPPAITAEGPAPVIAKDPPVHLPDMRRGVGDRIQSELAKVHRLLSSGATEDVERNARILASLVKTLAELRRLEALDPLAIANTHAAGGQDEERPPRDLATLRDELARALERLSGDPAGPGAGE
jgi:hypothetical protein